MNALVGFTAIRERSIELDRGFLRRLREASLHQIRMMRAAHATLGCQPVFGTFACWRCRALDRAEGKR
jgi:hypothetical protein